MEVNIGKGDRIIRFVLGLISIYFGYVYSPYIYIISVILIGTSFVGFCGLYKLLGISTVRSKKKTVPKKKVRSKK